MMITLEKLYQNISKNIRFLSKKNLNTIKKGLFLVTKGEIQVITTMIMHTRSSKKICNPSRCTGNILYPCSMFISHAIVFFHIDFISIIMLTN